MDLESADYGRYRDVVSDWQKDRDYAQGAYDSAYNRDYANWSTMLSYWQQQAQLENSDYWVRKQNEKKKGGGGGGGRKKNTGLIDMGNGNQNKNTGGYNPGKDMDSILAGEVVKGNITDPSTINTLLNKGYLTVNGGGNGSGNGNNNDPSAAEKANQIRKQYGGNKS